MIITTATTVRAVEVVADWLLTSAVSTAERCACVDYWLVIGYIDLEPLHAH